MTANPLPAHSAPQASAELVPHASTELQLRLNLGHDGITAAELANFQFYCRRVGLSYEDMAAIVRTRFINPNTGISARVEVLGVSFEVIQALKAGIIAEAEFVRPATRWTRSGRLWRPSGRTQARLRAHHRLDQRRGELRPDHGPPRHCKSRGQRRCRAPRRGSASGMRTPTRPGMSFATVDFVRLLRFIRLWRKLRLSIDQTDAVITALYPTTANDSAKEAADLKHLDAGFTVLLARIGALLQVMNLLSLCLPNVILHRCLPAGRPSAPTAANRCMHGCS